MDCSCYTLFPFGNHIQVLLGQAERLKNQCRTQAAPERPAVQPHNLLALPPCRYLSYIQDKPSKANPLMAVLRDSTKAVLSLSPVINAQFCRVTNTANSQDILVEVSGSESLELVQKVASEFIEQFAKAVKTMPMAAVEGGCTGPQQQQLAQVRLLTQGTGHVRLVFPSK
jgi:hypothetical protein